MKKSKLYYLWPAISLLPVFLCAQSAGDIPITARFEQATLEQVFTRLESAYPVRFFYKSADLPQQKIDADFRDTRLADALQQLLGNTLAGYLFYREHSVIIIPRRLLDESFSANFYQTLENNLYGTEEEETYLPIGQIEQLRSDGQARVSGVIIDEQTKEPVIGATVFWEGLEKGEISDVDGVFESVVPAGQHEILIRSVGYQDTRRKLEVFSDGRIEIPIRKAAIDLEEVVVEADAPDVNLQEATSGIARLDVKTIKELPAFLGEADVVKSLLLNPGVSTVGEGATGFNVRGGEVDQNLILQDEGFIFNASHALGFFSTFNADLIKNVTLYKGNIPAQYGGRLASVLDVEMREGSFDKFRIKGGGGMVASRLSLEGPVIRKKSAFLLGLRTSYADWLLKLVSIPEVRRSSAFFFDGNIRYTHRLNEKNTLTFSAYSSQDEFSYNEDFGFDYSTLMGQVVYKKIFTDDFFTKFSLTGSQYKSTRFELDTLNASRLDHNLSYLKFKGQATYIPVAGLQFDGGISSIYYQVEPGALKPNGGLIEVTPKQLETELGLESAAFLNAEWEVNPLLLISGGIRFALYQFLGPKDVYQYEDPEHPDAGEVTGIMNYGSGDVIASYTSLEPRLSVRYRLGSDNSVKFGYSRTAQFINQIYNTDSPTPISQFQLSTAYIKPQRSHNFSLGYFHNFKKNLWESSAEVFYRNIDALFDYRDFADLNVNDHLETELMPGQGNVRGLELSIKKKEGVVNGWLAYTWSKSRRQVAGINRNDWYPSNFDKPHDISLVFNYQPNQRNIFTLNFNYSTGRPISAPLGNYQSNVGLVTPVYSERNQIRIPDYHRVDIAYTIGKGYRKDAKFRTSWTFSIYNLYSRRNAYSVFFTRAAFRNVQANRLAILGSMLPAITFNFELL
ncbi:MAG: carboxypeptidase-like regulatory domain-containing protein [Lewinellaceae bacterium]|nr:carboxypeptidase-like regulatory domain-containing protein [Lewinellaceae bacterium]